MNPVNIQAALSLFDLIVNNQDLWIQALVAIAGLIGVPSAGAVVILQKYFARGKTIAGMIKGVTAYAQTNNLLPNTQINDFVAGAVRLEGSVAMQHLVIVDKQIKEANGK